MKDSILTICIPTYNGVDKLEECLNRIVPLVQDKNITIIISDNASTEDIKGMIQTFNYDYLEYYRNEINLGADKNFEKVLSYTNTKYAWLLGNDDYFQQESFEIIYELLKNEEYDAVFVNSGNRISGIKTGLIQGGKNLINKLGAHLTYMSCLIFNTKNFNFNQAKIYYDTWFWQTGLVYNIFANDNARAYWISNNVISVCDKCSCNFSSEYLKTFICRLYDFSRLLPNYYTEQEKDLFVFSHCKYINCDKFKSILSYKELGQINKNFVNNNKEKIIVACGKRGYRLFKISLIVPNCFIRFAKKLKSMLHHN